MLRRVIPLLCFGLGALVPEGATAGAFMVPEGQGQFIAGVGYSEASRRFDPSGTIVKAPAYRKAEASGYLEYGLTPLLSIVLAPTLSHTYASAATNSVTGSDESAFGARLQIYGAPHRVLAVQALFEPPVGTAGRTAALDVRLMLGQAFEMLGWPAFVDLEPGMRLRAEPFANEARLDLTAGVRPTGRLLLMIQNFDSFARSSGPAVPREAYSKVQISAVYDLSRTLSMQLGAVCTVAGRDALREVGPLAALWYRF